MFRLTRWYSIAIFATGGLAVVVFAFASVNLFSTAMASVGFISEYKLAAIRNGALWQVGELVIYGSIALSAWLTFKICEHIIVDRYLDWSKAPRQERQAQGNKAEG